MEEKRVMSKNIEKIQSIYQDSAENHSVYLYSYIDMQFLAEKRGINILYREAVDLVVTAYENHGAAVVDREILDGYIDLYVENRGK